MSLKGDKETRKQRGVRDIRQQKEETTGTGDPKKSAKSSNRCKLKTAISTAGRQSEDANSCQCTQVRKQYGSIALILSLVFTLLVLRVSPASALKSASQQQVTKISHWNAGGVKTAANQAGARHVKRGARQAWPAATSLGGTLERPAKSMALRHADVFLSTTDNLGSSSRLRAPVSGQLASRSIREAQSSSSSSSSVKCALILQRTYVRKLSNDIENDADVEPTGRAERVCISYEDVNKAIEEAKRLRNFRLTPELQDAIQSIEPEPPFISKLGELNLQVVKLLKERFDLSPDEIVNGLPLIDMSRTSFWPLCPLMVKPIKCDPTGRFRSFTGHCNNLQNPTWGAAQTPFTRYLQPKHPDGIEEFRVSALDGSQLPPARLVSSTVHRDADKPSGDLSLLIMVFGQLVDHELTQAAPPRDENGLDFNCCKEPAKSEYCSPIAIPQNDPLYSRYGQGCMDFKRSLVGLRPSCRLGPRVHINTITATIDGNTIYGSTKAVADQLRTFSGGLLKVQNAFKSMNLKPLLPKQVVRPDLDCFERPNNMYCFLAGDDRVNEQPTLTVMHTIMVREHNRLASQLARLNPHWDDDRIFHETRHLVAAKIQFLIFNEYLPMLIGKELMMLNNITMSRQDLYSSEYDPEMNPSISQGFTTAAFRQGHTFIQGKVRLHDSRSHNFIDSIALRKLFKRPFHYYSPGRMDNVLAGVLSTPAQTYDPFITQEIAGHLFQEPGEEFGMDLISINLQRGREQGTPGYAEYRERLCGLPRVRTFEDLLPIMTNRTAFQYSRLYKSPADIDLWSGGVSELPLEGALVGPTFACIIARQMAHVRNADRFWFENPNQPSSFTPAQLREIKKSSLAKLLCTNSDGMQFVQRKALRLPHAVINPRISCKDLDDTDLRYWREDPANLGSFFT